MLVVEDDIMLPSPRAVELPPPRADLHYYGWCGSGFWCNHATLFTPKAAALLLRLTESCLSRGQGIDFIMAGLCGHMHWSGKASLHYKNRKFNITCAREARSLFVQNKSVPSYQKKPKGSAAP